MTDGEPMETISLKVSLPAPLPPGEHVISLVVPTYGYKGDGPGIARLTRTFTVSAGPTGRTLPANQDSTLRSNKPHENEGANPILLLDKHNKEMPVVGFDLSGVNLTGLTRARLVLTATGEVPGDSGHGPDKGGQVVVNRLTTGWVEGNAWAMSATGSQSGGKNNGSGPGVTWFSPVDPDISNKRSDGAASWNGAFSASANPTAQPVFVPDGFHGEVVFDVTQDVLAGAGFGWVIRMQTQGHKDIVFSSREGGAAPRLELEFGLPTAQGPDWLTRLGQQMWSTLSRWAALAQTPQSTG